MKPISDGLILVIDDETGVTRLCERFLSRAGFTVITANDPRAGLPILESQPIDLLLADIRMPEIDGFQLMSKAREFRPDLAVVIMTGYGTVETAVESLHQGADGMVLKPFSGAELVQTIQRALRTRQLEREMLRLMALRPLFAITEKLFAEKDPARLRELFLDVLQEQFACSHVAYYFHPAAAAPIEPGSQRGPILALDERSPVHQVDQRGEPLLLTPESAGDSATCAWLQEMGLAAIFCLPIQESERRAILLAGRKAGSPAFDDADHEMLLILSRQVSVALENARLYEELRAKIRQVEESQRALIQAEKLAAIGRLTASMAHEINNPLQAVENCLHLIDHAELGAQARQNYLEMAREELERLIQTVRRMLEYYRPGVTERVLVDVNTIVEKVLRLLEPQLRNNNIRVYQDWGTEIPQVLVVENQIQQVFFNIVLNAMQVMPTGGELHIQTRPGCDGQVDTIFEDTGPGVSEENSNQIFEPFISTKENGLGLGLTVSYGIVSAHGGNLELLPKAGRGARFRVSLPTGTTSRSER